MSKQCHDDVPVTEFEERGRAVSREPSELGEPSELYTLPAMRESLFRCRQVGLEVFCKILDIHSCFLALLCCQPVLNRQLPEDLRDARMPISLLFVIVEKERNPPCACYDLTSR